MSKKRTKWLILSTIAGIVAVGYLPSFRCIVPVKNATTKDWNKNSYWYYPWGVSGVHKGIDIFAPKGTDIVASTGGVVLSAGQNKLGGNYVAILGPKWRVTYYAHLEEIKTKPLRWVKQGEVIGSVGTSGNAKGKQPHLHFAIVSLVPQLGKIDKSRQGWKKAFYLNPQAYLN